MNDSLVVTVIEARGLPSQNIGGKSDPFCTLQIRSPQRKNGEEKVKTSVVKQSLQPQWNEEFVFQNVEEDHELELIVECWDYNILGSNDLIGKVAIPIGRLQRNHCIIDEWYPLLDTKKFRGTIRILMRFDNSESFLSLWQKEFNEDLDIGALRLKGFVIDSSEMPIFQHVLSLTSNGPLVKALIKLYKMENLDINSRDSHGNTVIHAAMQNTTLDVNLLKELLKDFPSLRVDYTNKEGDTALHYFAQRFRNAHSCIEIGKIMIWKGQKENVRFVNIANQQGETALHYAVRNNNIRLLLVDLLLNAGAKIDQQNLQGESCFTYAIRLGRKDIIARLMVAGADVEQEVQSHKIPSNATIQSYLDQAKRLISWATSEKIPRQYVNIFLREELFLDVLGEIGDTVLDRLNIDDAVDRINIKNACTKLGRKGLRRADATFQLPSLKSNCKTGLRSRGEDGYHMSIDDLIIPSKEVEYTKKLGQGTSGNVYAGLYRGKEVAIKVLENQEIELFKKEFLILSSVKSPHIVHFYGACIEPHLAMVMDLCSKHSLFDFMNDPNEIIGWDMFFHMTLQICRGIKCLHQWKPQIVHRDIKTANFVVTADYDVLLTDFGLSRFVTASNLQSLQRACGTIVYCPPEIFSSRGTYNTAADIYSLAICFWELLVRVIYGQWKKPYAEYTHVQYEFQILELVQEEVFRPSFPPSCPKSLQALVKGCWCTEPDKRPPIDVLLKQMLEVQQEYKANKEVWEGTLLLPVSVAKSN